MSKFFIFVKESVDGLIDHTTWQFIDYEKRVIIESSLKKLFGKYSDIISENNRGPLVFEASIKQTQE